MLLEWISENSEIITIFFAVIPVLWSVITYIDIKKKEAQYRQFKIYHNLIKQLVEPETLTPQNILIANVRLFLNYDFMKSIFL